MVILDIDFFKRVNDSVGHQAGDDVLKEFTRRFQANKRDEDVTGRWGGEEFLLILPETEIDGAMAAAERSGWRWLPPRSLPVIGNSR